jgi:membrane protease YdiL (CAAX protease family)
MSVTHMLCGTLLGLCATDTDSVWTGIGFHALWNMLGLVLGRVYVLHGPAEQAEWAVLVCACIVMALRLKRKEDRHV